MGGGEGLQKESVVKEATSFALWYHPLYTAGLHPDARFPRDRYELLLARLEASKARAHMDIRTPDPIDRELLLLAHDRDYVERFLTDNLGEKEQKRIGLTPWTPAMISRTLCLMGGALEATEHAVQSRGFSGNMAGGTHHAHRDFGSGYCVFNDLAVSALHAIKNLGVKRVAILDLDVHQGDGTATILAHEKQICTISVHCSTNFPFRKSVSDHDLAIPAQSEDEHYLETVVQALETCMAFEPDLVLFQAGVDALKADALGKLNVSREGMRRRNQLVFDAVHQQNLPLVIFMGGGYAKPIDASLDAFFDLFTDAAMWPHYETPRGNS